MFSAPLAFNLEANQKVTSQSLHLDLLKCTCNKYCCQKSLIFHCNEPILLGTCTKVSFPKTATRGKQRCTVLWSLRKGSFGFYRELQWQAHSSFSPNNVTEQRFQRFLQPPSAIFQATSPFRLPKILLSVGTENSSWCLQQSSREWKPFSIKRNSESPN